MDVDFSDLQNSGSGGGGGGSGAGGNNGGAGGGGGGGGGGGDDITSDLLQKFSCMNTNDREVLIQQFKILLGEKSATTNVEFWLDMNNWNLEAAVCAYFDHDGSNNALSPFPFIKLPSMTFTPSDNNFVDRIPVNTPFFYHCIITNSGDEPWPVGCTLRFVGGTQLSSEERITLPSLSAGQSAEVKFSFISPPVPGGHECTWRPATLTGQFFGETIFIIINVYDDLSTVTQQLSNANLMDSSEGGGGGSSSSSNFLIRSGTLQTPLPLCTVTPMGTQNSPLSAWENLSRTSGALVSTDIFGPPMTSPNNFTAGMCLPGSTTAGHLGGPSSGAEGSGHHQLANGSIPSMQQQQHQQHNAFLGGTPPQSTAQSMQQQQQPASPLMLTFDHLSGLRQSQEQQQPPPPTSSPSSATAASQHEPIDDSMS